MEKINLLLKPYASDLPNLIPAFSQAYAIAPEKRLAWAKTQRESIFRDGWHINTPVGRRGDGETVDDHVRHLIQLIDRYFPNDIKDQATLYAEYHDDHEVLAHAVVGGIKRDLNPLFNKKSYAISTDDKHQIELLARAVLFENAPDLKNALDSYPKAADPAARAFADLDKICVMWRCVEYVESGKYEHADFQAYWEYWTPENVRKKCSDFISDIYENELWPRVKIPKELPPVPV